MSAAGPVRARYFQIGFRRCGTTALAAFFNRCAIPCVHHDGGRLVRRMRDNLAAARAPLDGYDRRYAAFTNIDFQTPTDHFDGFRHFDALLAEYGGRCILNTRPVEHWLESVMRNAAHPRRRAAYRARFGTDDPREVAGHWRTAWEEHHRRVLAEIPAESLLVFDIESDPPERLCDFIGVPRSRARWATARSPARWRLPWACRSAPEGPATGSGARRPRRHCLARRVPARRAARGRRLRRMPAAQRGLCPALDAARARPHRLVRSGPARRLPAAGRFPGACPAILRQRMVEVPLEHMIMRIKYMSLGFPEGMNVDANGTTGRARAGTGGGAVARRGADLADFARRDVRGKFARRN